jgi:hypothetical protein
MERFLNWLGFVAVMYGPHRITVSADNPIGRWCLPRAGAHAYPPDNKRGA